jgi:hypothetical protein
MLRVKNTSTIVQRSLLHRKAAKLEMEPVVNGQRLRMGTSTDLSEEVYERNKPTSTSSLEMASSRSRMSMLSLQTKSQNSMPKV